MAQVLVQPEQAAWGKSEASVTQVSAAEEYQTPPGGPYGERLVVNTVDELARRSPDRIYATVSKSPQGLHDGFRDITVRQLADAVNCASWFIDETFGRCTSFEVIAYLGVSDVRYAVYTYASIKTGHVVSCYPAIIGPHGLQDKPLVHGPLSAELVVTASCRV